MVAVGTRSGTKARRNGDPILRQNVRTHNDLQHIPLTCDLIFALFPKKSKNSCVKSHTLEALFSVMNLEDAFWRVIGWCLLAAAVATTARYILWLFQ